MVFTALVSVQTSPPPDNPPRRTALVLLSLHMHYVTLSPSNLYEVSPVWPSQPSPNCKIHWSQDSWVLSTHRRPPGTANDQDCGGHTQDGTSVDGLEATQQLTPTGVWWALLHPGLAFSPSLYPKLQPQTLGSTLMGQAPAIPAGLKSGQLDCWSSTDLLPPASSLSHPHPPRVTQVYSPGLHPFIVLPGRPLSWCGNIYPSALTEVP